jgi:hypothetical protein
VWRVDCTPSYTFQMQRNFELRIAATVGKESEIGVVLV